MDSLRKIGKTSTECRQVEEGIFRVPRVEEAVQAVELLGLLPHFHDGELEPSAIDHFQTEPRPVVDVPHIRKIHSYFLSCFVFSQCFLSQQG